MKITTYNFFCSQSYCKPFYPKKSLTRFLMKNCVFRILLATKISFRSLKTFCNTFLPYNIHSLPPPLHQQCPKPGADSVKVLGGYNIFAQSQNLLIHSPTPQRYQFGGGGRTEEENFLCCSNSFLVYYCFNIFKHFITFELLKLFPFLKFWV